MKESKNLVVIETYNSLQISEKIENVMQEKWAVIVEDLDRILELNHIPTFTEIKEKNLYVIVIDKANMVRIDSEDVKFWKVNKEWIYTNQDIEDMYKEAKYRWCSYESIKEEYDWALDL